MSYKLRDTRYKTVSTPVVDIIVKHLYRSMIVRCKITLYMDRIS
jgi:hypothetical protein